MKPIPYCIKRRLITLTYLGALVIATGCDKTALEITQKTKDIAASIDKAKYWAERLDRFRTDVQAKTGITIESVEVILNACSDLPMPDAPPDAFQEWSFQCTQTLQDLTAKR